MSKLRWSRWSSVALVVAIAVPVAVVGAVSTSAAPPAVPELDWQPCGDDFPGAECAIATVPLDYDDPGAGTTEIALARYAATDAANRIGSVFVNPGGPGGSGVELVLLGFGEFLSAGLDGRFDIVGFDPRGIGFSDPLHCFDSVEALEAFFATVPVASRTNRTIIARSTTPSRPSVRSAATTSRSPST